MSYQHIKSYQHINLIKSNNLIKSINLIKSNKVEDLNCINCNEKGKHSSLSKENCPTYKKKLQYATSLIDES